MNARHLPTAPDDGLAPHYDDLLEDGLVTPPDHFSDALLLRIESESGLARDPVRQRSRLSAAARAAAVGIGAMAALWQMLGFAFGLWATTNAF